MAHKNIALALNYENMSLYAIYYTRWGNLIFTGYISLSWFVFISFGFLLFKLWLIYYLCTFYTLKRYRRDKYILKGFIVHQTQLQIIIFKWLILSLRLIWIEKKILRKKKDMFTINKFINNNLAWMPRTRDYFNTCKISFFIYKSKILFAFNCTVCWCITIKKFQKSIYQKNTPILEENPL